MLIFREVFLGAVAKTIVLAVLTVACMTGCGSSAGAFGGGDADSFQFSDLSFGSDADSGGETGAGGKCSILWKKNTYLASSASHPAWNNGKVFVGAYGKVYAIAEGGAEAWVWPDDDAESSVEHIDAMLNTPAVGKNGVLYVGSGKSPQGKSWLLALNPNGLGKWRLELDSAVSEAPAVMKDGMLLVLSRGGRVYKVKDMGQDRPFVSAQYPAAEGDSAGTTVPGGQVLLDERLDVEPRAFALFSDRLVLLNPEDLSETDSLAFEDGGVKFVATANGLLDGDGVYCFGYGKGAQGSYFKEFGVACQGQEGTWTLLPLTGSTGAVSSVSLGRDGTFLVGTVNRGFFLLHRESGSVVGQYFQSFQNCSQGIQSGDGLVYFGAGPALLNVLGVNGDVVWDWILEKESGDLQAEFPPSSPLLLDSGVAVFHAGNRVVAVDCGGTGPDYNIAWLRYGGNNKNTGNLGDREYAQ